MKFCEIKSKWYQYFFADKPVEGIAIFRILLGILALFTFYQDALLMEDFWGPYAIQSPKTSMMNYNFPVLNIFQHFVITENLMNFFIGLQFIALLCFTIGFKTRFSSIIAFILIVSFHQRNINMLSSADLLMRIFFMFMIFAPSGNIYSVDCLIAKFKGRVIRRDHASWTLRLIQIQIAIVYLSTAIAKVQGETWLDGSAIYYATRLGDFTRFTTPFILDWKWSISLITWSTLILEFSLGTLIFLDKLKKPLILIGIIFHLGIEYMMSIPTFEWLMIIGLIAMFKIEDYRTFDGYLRNWLNNKSASIKKIKILKR